MTEMDTTVKRRVLIVDDDIDFAEGLVDILESHHCELQVANGSKEATEKLQNFDADVALIDVRLGPADGLDLIKQLKAIRPDLLCITMTAYAAKESAIEALRLGAYDYLRKPLNGEDLLATLDRCFDKKQLELQRSSTQKQLADRNRELERVNQRLRMIVESAKKFAHNHKRTCKESARMLLDEYARVLESAGGSIYLREDDALVLAHSVDPGHAPERLVLPLDPAGAIGRAIEQGRAILIGDIGHENSVNSSGWSGYRDGSLMVFPLITDDERLVGVVSLHNKVQPPFTEQDLDLGMILASFSVEALRPC